MLPRHRDPRFDSLMIDESAKMAEMIGGVRILELADILKCEVNYLKGKISGLQRRKMYPYKIIKARRKRPAEQKKLVVELQDRSGDDREAELYAAEVRQSLERFKEDKAREEAEHRARNPGLGGPITPKGEADDHRKSSAGDPPRSRPRKASPGAPLKDVVGAYISEVSSVDWRRPVKQTVIPKETKPSKGFPYKYLASQGSGGYRDRN